MTKAPWMKTLCWSPAPDRVEVLGPQPCGPGLADLPQKGAPWMAPSRNHTTHPLGGGQVLTVGDVAAESKGKIPPQAMMMLSTIWEMRWMVLCTKMMFSLLLTKSITDFVEWLKQQEKNTNEHFLGLRVRNLDICNIFKWQRRARQI